jgi:hypothetical protein
MAPNPNSGHAYAFMNCRAPKSDVEWIANGLKRFLAQEIPAPILDSLVLRVNQGTTFMTKRGSLIEAKAKLREFILDAEADGAVFLTPGPRTFHLTEKAAQHQGKTPDPLVIAHSEKSGFYQPVDGLLPDPDRFVYVDSSPLVRLSIAVNKELFAGNRTVTVEHDFGYLYAIRGTMPGLSNEDAAGWLSTLMTDGMHHPLLYHSGEPFRGVIAYARDGDYFVYKSR